MNMTGYVLFWYLLGVKFNLGPRPQNKILVPFRGHFQKIRRAPPSLLYGSPHPGPFQARGIWKGRDFTGWSIEKGWENFHFGIKRDFQNISNRRT